MFQKIEMIAVRDLCVSLHSLVPSRSRLRFHYGRTFPVAERRFETASRAAGQASPLSSRLSTDSPHGLSCLANVRYQPNQTNQRGGGRGRSGVFDLGYSLPCPGIIRAWRRSWNIIFPPRHTRDVRQTFSDLRQCFFPSLPFRGGGRTTRSRCDWLFNKVRTLVGSHTEPPFDDPNRKGPSFELVSITRCGRSRRCLASSFLPLYSLNNMLDVGAGVGSKGCKAPDGMWSVQAM